MSTRKQARKSPAAPASDAVTGLIAAQPADRALLQDFYRSADIFERDIERIFLRRWLLVGHTSQIPAPGDYRVIDLAAESVIIVRGKDGEIRALLNVCRHRGSHVCYEKEGHVVRFVCPYHAWTYDLDGALRAARHTGDDFEKANFRLKQIHARVIDGMIFICFADEPPDLTNVERTLHASLGRYGWADARVAHRETFTMAANWKHAIENYLECYHCAPAHPEYARLHNNEQLRETDVESTSTLAKRAWTQGIAIEDRDSWMLDPFEPAEDVFCLRVGLYDKAVTGSEDGSPVAPLMGDFTDYDGGATFVHVGPASFFLAYADHGICYRFAPCTVDTTDLEVLWLVRADAEEGRDFDRSALSWLWQVTSEEGKLIVENNQRGVNSRFYTPGPYTPQEPRAKRFTAWYLGRIAWKDESHVEDRRTRRSVQRSHRLPDRGATAGTRSAPEILYRSGYLRARHRAGSHAPLALHRP